MTRQQLQIFHLLQAKRIYCHSREEMNDYVQRNVDILETPVIIFYLKSSWPEPKIKAIELLFVKRVEKVSRITLCISARGILKFYDTNKLQQSDDIVTAELNKKMSTTICAKLDLPEKQLYESPAVVSVKKLDKFFMGANS